MNLLSFGIHSLHKVDNHNYYYLHNPINDPTEQKINDMAVVHA